MLRSIAPGMAWMQKLGEIAFATLLVFATVWARPASAQDDEATTAAARALDRVLTAGRYVIPFWQFTEDRIAHVAALKYPSHVPLYGDGPNYMPEVWWIEPAQ